jgi:glyoxalase family protein
MRQSGRKGRKGTGQIDSLALSIPVSALGFWEKRLGQHGFRVKKNERFGEKVLQFQHPCGIDYELVGIADDDRKPYSNGQVPKELAIRGTHGITVSARDVDLSEEFLSLGWSARRAATDGRYTRYVFGDGGTGRIVDLVHDPDRPQGTWTFGEGIVHHCAFQVDDLAVQDAVKAHLEGLGFTDVSDRKDRGYFFSVYVRTPAGALFEATVSKPTALLLDERYDELGKNFQIPPVFAQRTKEILEFLEPLKYDR